MKDNDCLPTDTHSVGGRGNEDPGFKTPGVMKKRVQVSVVESDPIFTGKEDFVDDQDYKIRKYLCISSDYPLLS